jgi:hypothetical protein
MKRFHFLSEVHSTEQSRCHEMHTELVPLRMTYEDRSEITFIPIFERALDITSIEEINTYGAGRGLQADLFTCGNVSLLSCISAMRSAGRTQSRTRLGHHDRGVELHTTESPVLPLTEHRAMKAYWGSGGTATAIL